MAINGAPDASLQVAVRGRPLHGDAAEVGLGEGVGMLALYRGGAERRRAMETLPVLR